MVQKLLRKLRHQYGSDAPYSEDSTHVDLDGDQLTITLRGAMNTAERYFANKENNRVFLETLYGRHLSFLKHDFEKDFTPLLQKSSNEMNVMVKPDMGDVTVTMQLVDA